MNRRQFLKVSALAGGGLLLESRLTQVLAQGAPASKLAEGLPPWLMVSISTDNLITLSLGTFEMGQSAQTGLAQIFAEELGADWKNIQVNQRVYDQSSHEFYTTQFGLPTGGSSSIWRIWQPAREAGAVIRELLKQEAANRWTQNVSDVDLKESFVVSKLDGRRLSMGALSTAAASLTVPETVELKNKKDFRIIGKELANLKTEEMVNGHTTYGIDKELPGMLYASIERCPWHLGTLVSVDKRAALAVPGVVDIVELAGQNESDPNYNTKAGVAVVATSTWAAMQGRKALLIEWDAGKNAKASTAALIESTKPENYTGETTSLTGWGDVDAGFESAKELIEAEYINHYQAHACMEPLNATALFEYGKLQLWTGTQGPTRDALGISKALSIPQENITVDVLQAGGSFGRRYHVDFSVEAALIAQAMPGKTVKLTWTREDTIQNDYYHPFAVYRFKAALDENNDIDCCQIDEFRDGQDWPSLNYGPRNFRIRLNPIEQILKIGAWRSVVEHRMAFAQECFMDELATCAERDPIEFRLAQLRKQITNTPDERADDKLFLNRAIHVLEKVASMSGWGNQLPEGVGQGIALSRFGRTVVAEVAEVSVNKGQVTVHKVYCATDSGVVINPQLAKGQVEGSIIWALTALLKGGIDVIDGQVVQSNFHDYQILRMNEIPEFHIELLESDGPIGGFGEPATPPLAPAVLNAIFAATGNRVRSLPLRHNGIA